MDGRGPQLRARQRCSATSALRPFGRSAVNGTGCIHVDRATPAGIVCQREIVVHRRRGTGRRCDSVLPGFPVTTAGTNAAGHRDPASATAHSRRRSTRRTNSTWLTRKPCAPSWSPGRDNTASALYGRCSTGPPSYSPTRSSSGAFFRIARRAGLRKPQTQTRVKGFQGRLLLARSRLGRRDGRPALPPHSQASRRATASGTRHIPRPASTHLRFTHWQVRHDPRTVDQTLKAVARRRRRQFLAPQVRNGVPGYRKSLSGGRGRVSVGRSRTERRRKHWGWGFADRQPGARRISRRRPPGFASGSGSAARRSRSRCRSKRSSSRRRGSSRRPRSSSSSPPTATSACPTPSARPTGTWSAAFAGRSTIPRTWSRGRARRLRSSRSSRGAPTRGWPRSPSAAAPASSAGSSRGWARRTAAR